MESDALEMDTSTAPDPRVPSDCSLACLRRRAWAQTRDSIWLDSQQEHCGPQGPQESQKDRDEQRPSEEPGRVPNNITSWLSECRTPLGASLDDQTAPPNRGVLRNGCSFEDDLSLGAEANHLQSSNKNKTDSCFGLAAEQKRSQYKEKGRSMNSTGSGKSSTVSSVSELLDLYEEDPEEVLLNLGFGREEPDLSSKVPSRFFNSSSSARGIDIKVYLGAQMQRMELENPNYALTSRFRQIEVLTTVANEFFQLYSQVSGQPVQRINSRDQGGGAAAGAAAAGGGGGEGGAGGGSDKAPPPLKRSNSALNVAKLLKKTLSKHNLLAAASESPEAQTPNQHTRLNGHSPSDNTHTNGHGPAAPEQDFFRTSPDQQVETVSQKQQESPQKQPSSRKKDSCPLATVTEETNGDAETDSFTDNRSEESGTGSPANGDHQLELAVVQSANQGTGEGPQEVKEEMSLTSTPVKTPHSLVPPHLVLLRTENADSFDMEEIQSNEDEGLPFRTSRARDLLRTVSQQSDSSGFAEEPSAESNSYLKVQESSDSCDSEMTVTSHPSQDVATPLALDQPAFDLPDAREEESTPGGAGEADGRNSSREEDENDGIPEEVPQYTAHYFPRNTVGTQLVETQGEEEEEEEKEEEKEEEEKKEEEEEEEKEKEVAPAERGHGTDLEPEPELEPEIPHSLSAAEQEPQFVQHQPETATDIEPPTERVEAEDEAQEENSFLDLSDVYFPPAPSSPVVNALLRAKHNHLRGAGTHVDLMPGEPPLTPPRGRGRRGFPMQRSSSLPSSLLSPSRVVSSVRIQFGQGQSSCTQPRYSFKYTPEEGEDKEWDEDEVEGQTNCLSTLIINPASNQPPRLPTDASIPPKPIPRYMMKSSCSLKSSSPPPDWSPGGQTHSWSSQSIPDLSSNQHLSGHFHQNQQSWNPGQMMSNYPNPTAQYINPCPNPSPSLIHSQAPFTMNPPPQYPAPLHPYASLPNLLYHNNQSLNPHSSMTSLHQPATPTVPPFGSISNLHQPSTSIDPHYACLGNLYPGTPFMHHQGCNHPYGHQSPYHAAPHGSPFSSTYPGFLPGMASTFNQGHSLYTGLHPPGPGHSQGPSSTEMQLRRVLHDIRGTVQSLTQNRAHTPDAFSDHTTSLRSQQSLTEFHQKRRSLNLFRSQMMDLEQSIMRQQAPVFKHLSPSDRLEVEQLQSLRSAVREELQELEQQLEDRLTQQRGLHRENSFDSLSTASVLRAMDPVSDLLREQLYLQSELNYGGHTPTTNPSSRSSSPGRGGRDQEQSQGVYRASINITPVLPPRPNTREAEEEEGKIAGGGEGVGDAPEDGAAGAVRVENLQQLIREIRESVAQEVRREIYSELLSAVSPRQSPLPSRQHHL
ncbi:unnamed protein product [Pleuronectes platessa]|uniref:ITPR-interacting domain-containing protein n=1 Tax=Pleuronectes platessa TaxID=8262 RepID=A0A9N7UGH1_PLEPL|nr:unnamed protein product [Pleuronectes platessa]